MRIGIDLDNTIIDYSNSFLHGVIDNHFFSQLKVNKILKDNISNKISIKELVKIEVQKFGNGEKKWQILQSKVYGDFIKFASINSEIYKFFTFANINNFEIYIISHKTKYGHYDKSKKLLRLAALNFLKNKKIIAKNMINKKNIYFASTLDEKIKKISELKLDYFIDDLKKVLNHKKFPRKTKKIHFSPYLKRNTYNWININSYFFKKKDEVELINNYSELLLKNKKLKISKINEGGNSNLYKIKTNLQLIY